MRIIFSFDDGRSDSFEASKILHSYGLVGVFHVTTGFIDGTFATDDFGKDRKSLTVDDLKQMKSYGMEISSHGDKHVLEQNDFQTSIKKLYNWKIIDYLRAGFSIPNSNYNEEQLRCFLVNCSKSLIYVRGGRSPHCYTFLSKINFVLYKITKCQAFYNFFNKLNLNDSLESIPIYCAVIKNYIRPKNILSFIERFSGVDKTLVLMFHSVVKKPKNQWEYSIDNFTTLCKGISFLIKGSKVRCGTFVDFLKEEQQK